MSRASDILNRLELAAKRMEMSIEHAVDILEGKHPTATIVHRASGANVAQNASVAAQNQEAAKASVESAHASTGVDDETLA